MDLGVNIKRLRKKKHLTLFDVATQTGIDMATLSRIENGKMTGTIQSHLAIAKVLNVHLPDLYEKAFNEKTKTESSNASSLFSHSSGSISEILIEQMFQKKMMPVRLTLNPKCDTSNEELPLGTERFLYVIQGKVDVMAHNDSRTIEEGESLYFNASIPHHFKNKGSSKAICLLITTPTVL